jgi:phosphotriesterase-related protein
MTSTHASRRRTSEGFLTWSRRLRAGICIVALANCGAAHADSLAGKVLTVNGPIAPAALGMTLPHEHLLMDFQPLIDTPEGWREAGEVKPSTAEEQAYYTAPFTMELIGAATMGQPNRDNRRLDDEALAIKEATDYKWLGGGSLVDVTSIGIKRDPAALKRIADATGLNIVMGSAWYEYGYVGDALDQRSVASLAEEIVNDITVGVANSGIRAGIIGEVGVKEAKRPYEKKILAAAARASLLSGAPISLHFARGYHDQLAALEALKNAGADLTRVAMGHSNPIADDLPLMKKILDQGAFLQFDLLGDAPHILTEMSDHDVAIAILELLKQGYGKQLLLSQDVCMKTDLKAYGGSGYSFIAEQFIPYLRQLGVTEAQITQMVVANPQRLLTFVEPRSARN